VPDRIFITPHGEVFFIEFKSEKGKVTKLQEKVIKDITIRDVDVFVVDHVEIGLEILALKNGDYFEC
jgi:hypothetical protein